MDDREVFQLISAEQQRQEEEITLIASENYASHDVLRATGSVLTNKYAEGYPNKRYYPGCRIIDQVEAIAIERCKQLFNAPHCNVQPHAGSQANMAAYFALLNPGDTILGMSLSAGGHLTHGHGVNFSGKLYKTIQYGVSRETEQLDYDALAELALQHKPRLIIVGASAYSRIIDFERFAAIAQQCNAYLLADIAHIAGLVVAGIHPNPFPHADVVTSTTHKTLRGPRGGLIMAKQQHAEAIDRAIIPGIQGGPFMQVIAAKAVAFHEAAQPAFLTYQQHVVRNAKTMAQTMAELGYRIVAGGTDNHLFVVDLRSRNISGRTAELALDKAGITISRSCIPFDPEKPWITSGIRIGTPAITTRGFKESEAIQFSHIIHEVLVNHDKDTVLTSIKEQVRRLAMQFPIYPQI